MIFANNLFNENHERVLIYDVISMQHDDNLKDVLNFFF